MDERTMRLQCLQQACQLLGINYGPDHAVAPADVLALAEKLYLWIKGA